MAGADHERVVEFGMDRRAPIMRPGGTLDLALPTAIFAPTPPDLRKALEALKVDIDIKMVIEAANSVYTERSSPLVVLAQEADGSPVIAFLERGHAPQLRESLYRLFEVIPDKRGMHILAYENRQLGTSIDVPGMMLIRADGSIESVHYLQGRKVTPEEYALGRTDYIDGQKLASGIVASVMLDQKHRTGELPAGVEQDEQELQAEAEYKLAQERVRANTEAMEMALAQAEQQLSGYIREADTLGLDAYAVKQLKAAYSDVRQAKSTLRGLIEQEAKALDMQPPGAAPPRAQEAALSAGQGAVMSLAALARPMPVPAMSTAPDTNLGPMAIPGQMNLMMSALMGRSSYSLGRAQDTKHSVQRLIRDDDPYQPMPAHNSY